MLVCAIVMYDEGIRDVDMCHGGVCDIDMCDVDVHHVDV